MGHHFLTTMAASNFDWFDTPDPRVRGFTIEAGEQDQDCDIPDFLGDVILFSECPDWITREAQVITALQGYQLTHAEKAGVLRRRFYFTKTRSAEEIATTIKSSYEVDPSFYWPPVLTGINVYPRDDGTYTFKPIYKEAYQGPTRLLIEEFFSPVPFTIPTYEAMMPQGADEVVQVVGSIKDWSIGRLVLKSCLHGVISFVLPLDPPVSEGILTYVQGSLFIAATNMTDWPATLVLDDRPREVLGGWLRRKVTAIRPS